MNILVKFNNISIEKLDNSFENYHSAVQYTHEIFEKYIRNYPNLSVNISENEICEHCHEEFESVSNFDSNGELI